MELNNLIINNNLGDGQGESKKGRHTRWDEEGTLAHKNKHVRFSAEESNDEPKSNHKETVGFDFRFDHVARRHRADIFEDFVPLQRQKIKQHPKTIVSNLENESEGEAEPRVQAQHLGDEDSLFRYDPVAERHRARPRVPLARPRAA